MQHIPFVKYQGTGNDFILIDARNHLPQLDVAHWCHRQFGIGADGLMYLTTHPSAHFTMIYYNSDGNISSMCGNGGRCIAHFASTLGLGDQLQFSAADGMHTAKVEQQQVHLSMNNVAQITQLNKHTYELNTGSPHYVVFTQEPLQKLDLIAQAQAIRYSSNYAAQGINVNFANINQGQLRVRTYERGVENETLSCGTGVTACALAYMHMQGLHGPQTIAVNTPGGLLQVACHAADTFTQIVLSGPANPVFSGSIPIN